jgi:C-terminal processing protease CtpA/Prc
VVSPHEDTINYSGEIYLLVDKVSYSAADLLAVFAKDTDFANLVGETTGGGGISDEPWLEMLPNSGYLFRFPLMMGTTSDGTVIEEHKTIPDYGVNFPKRNKNLSYDLAIQKVLELEGLE